MRYKRLEIPELILCEPTLHKDNRGFVFEAFKKESFDKFVGFEVDFCQDNISYSKYGVIRGLHTNSLNHAQSKLVSVLQGKILDVAVDFRVGSPTFGKAISIELDSFENRQFFIPRGFLHGFSVLSQDAIVNIKIDRYFASGESIGVRFDDKDLAINWKLRNKDIILGEGDKNLKSFKEVKSPFIYKDNLY
ncbi:dTDP-4-dehydrorhamnose 3,5-epimerase [Aliarcobacter butzleri]|uniref:dTDP-4-dehydrorhamnose 3,5-epimerase n=1 Tax=Aliarcobacter butzleri TaxID=28197 RepID=UPI0021B4BA79|nr:dTDP-4-dehydrorhamnose 3,5-epimerase [Aliarcobacter butzleri]MCT7557127.1 dTDP-4-dehydrorhamnose 3,5-epimerase [Aliarcobacter butzleri]MCT7622155.1 dTDP-4-dehydrorhamnose 3,5-epimerase [Aliarcobacter butzleri]MCT7633558.1 dTDP-4-dehydrorhamnose 3,5-epimerase [Aliarcobacter butzleri]